MGLLRWGTLAAMLVLLVSTVQAQGTPGSHSNSDIGSGVEAKRARWDRLSPAEKTALRARFQKLQSLPEAERAELVDRAQRLAREMVAIEGSLGEEERAALDALEPRERAASLRGMVADRARQAASRLRSSMTPEERQRVEAAAPGERAQILRAIRERELSRLPAHIASLGEDLGLSLQELGRIREGTPNEQRADIARLLRRRIEKQVSEEGLPTGFSPSRWDRLRSMGDGGFLRALQNIRRRHPGFGIPRQRWEARLRRSVALADRLEGMGMADRRPDPQGRARTPRLSERLSVRRATLARRERIEDLVLRHAKLDLELSARFRALPDQEFLVLHSIVIRVLREGGDVTATLERWFEGGRGGDAAERDSVRER